MGHPQPARRRRYDPPKQKRLGWGTLVFLLAFAAFGAWLRFGFDAWDRCGLWWFGRSLQTCRKQHVKVLVGIVGGEFAAPAREDLIAQHALRHAHDGGADGVG